MKTRVLITGGSGFIGKNLVNGLTKKNNKYLLFSPSSVELDILDDLKLKNFIKDNSIDIVVHSAIKGASKGKPSDVLEHTLKMYASLLKNSKLLKKIIHIGSGAEYAKNREVKKISENDFGVFVPQDEYGLAKYYCSLVSNDPQQFLTLRPFGIYGPLEDYRYKFISNSIVKHILGLPITINRDVIFDYLYIDDFVKVVDYFLNHNNKYAHYNVSPKKPIKLTEIIAIIDEIGRRKSDLKILNSGLNFEYSGDSSRLSKEIPNLNFTSYKKGIEKLYQYYLDLYQKNLIDENSIKKDDFLKKVKGK